MRLHWRAAGFQDALAISNLLGDCDVADCALESMAAEAIASAIAAGSDVTVAVADNRVIAAGWLDPAMLGGSRLMLRGWVAPDARRRGVGTALLTRLLDAAHLYEYAALRVDRVLAPKGEGVPPDAAALYEAHGFRFNYVEEELRRSTVGLSEARSPAGVSIDAWSRELDARALLAYNAAFSTRPAFSPVTEQGWEGRYSAEADFREAATFFAVADSEICGFIFCSGHDDGYIESIGVVPAWRGLGIADALIVHAIDAFRRAGLTYSFLRVNENNERARRLYDRLGFAPSKRHVSYVHDEMDKR